MKPPKCLWCGDFIESDAKCRTCDQLLADELCCRGCHNEIEHDTIPRGTVHLCGNGIAWSVEQDRDAYVPIDRPDQK